MEYHLVKIVVLNFLSSSPFRNAHPVTDMGGGDRQTVNSLLKRSASSALTNPDEFFAKLKEFYFAVTTNSVPKVIAKYFVHTHCRRRAQKVHRSEGSLLHLLPTFLIIARWTYLRSYHLVQFPQINN
jgi:hypothetical protein